MKNIHVTSLLLVNISKKTVARHQRSTPFNIRRRSYTVMKIPETGYDLLYRELL